MLKTQDSYKPKQKSEAGRHARAPQEIANAAIESAIITGLAMIAGRTIDNALESVGVKNSKIGQIGVSLWVLSNRTKKLIKKAKES